LHRAVIAEFKPVGVLEENIVRELAHLLWRKQNLAFFRIVERARARREQIRTEAEYVINSLGLELYQRADADERERLDAIIDAARDRRQRAEEQIREELGDYLELTNIGEPATIEGLLKELDVKERLDSLIFKCLKQLLAVRGVKSLSSESSSVSKPQIARLQKAG
jgi:vacuolar-type H+-ATPase subunit I/STV1